MESGSSPRLESILNIRGNPSLQPALKKFHRGEPLALGITQIIVGILEVTFGILIDLEGSDDFHGVNLKVPVWTGILCIISGSLSVVAAKYPKKSLVITMLAMNVVSAVVVGVAVVTASLSVYSKGGSVHLGCSSITDAEWLHICRNVVTIYSIRIILLVSYGLLFLITLSTSATGCATMCHGTGNYDTTTTVVVYQTSAEGAPALPSPSKEAPAP